MTIDNTETLYYKLALSFVQGIGPKMAAILTQHCGSAKAVFECSEKRLLHIEGLGLQKVKAIKDQSIFKKADQELSFVEKNNIELLTSDAENYPKRLLECVDAPLLLYHKGNTDFNVPYKISIIGTRKNTEYGQRLCQDLVEGLSDLKEVLIISGLAHGIDTLAHKAALKHQLKTVGVLGHGLNMIYPSSNRNLAKEMLQQGGLLTEFSSQSKTDKGNFPARNRIVAGLADVCVVVESDIRGGALITALLAQGYNREIAAFPGRAYDAKSGGTNRLIQKNIAALIQNAQDLKEFMAWVSTKKNKVVQKELQLNLCPEEQTIVTLLQEKDATHADELLLKSGLGSSILANHLLLLEMQGLIKALPGKFFRLN